MEPLSTGTAALASIIGLIGQFKSGRDSAKSQDFDEFMQWLAESNHAELKSKIEANHETTISIKAFLKLQDDKTAEVLTRIESGLTAIAFTVAELANLAKSIHPEKELPTQAISFLKACSKLKDGRIRVFRAMSGPVLTFVTKPENPPLIAMDNEKFLEDDLALLVSLGYLTKYGDESTTIYCITRLGENFIKNQTKPST